MTEELVKNFATGHQAIVNSLDQVQLLAHSYIKAKPRIRELQELLLNHFARQRDDLNELLCTAHQSDREAIKMIEFLREDLKDLKIKFITFFEKYPGEMSDVGSGRFPSDLIIFSRDVLARLKIEEEYLFPLIEKLPV